MLAEHKRRFLRWTLPNSSEFPDEPNPERGSAGSGAVRTLCRTVAGCVPAWQCRAGKVQLRGRLVPLSGYQVLSGEVQRSSAEWGLSGEVRGLQVLSGSDGSVACLWGLPSVTAQYRAAALRCCARCSPLYWLLPAKTQLPPYGGLREFELKCLRSHLPYSGSTHRHSQRLQCFLSRSPALSSSFQ